MATTFFRHQFNPTLEVADGLYSGRHLPEVHELGVARGRSELGSLLEMVIPSKQSQGDSRQIAGYIWHTGSSNIVRKTVGIYFIKTLLIVNINNCSI